MNLKIPAGLAGLAMLFIATGTLYVIWHGLQATLHQIDANDSMAALALAYMLAWLVLVRYIEDQ